MENKMRVENWCGYDIRFVEINGEWYAILKDICDALHLKTFKVSQRLDPSMMERVRITCDIPLRDVRSKARHTQDMIAINEIGIYEALLLVDGLKLVSLDVGQLVSCRNLEEMLGLKDMRLCV